jgi:ubiquinone/menaquinone biosynthesis C-methylase UbiE
LFLLAGCAADAPRAVAPETSVRPGINESYAEPDLEQWTERFETESREIFRQRERIVARLNLGRGQRVADIGAGTGLFMALLSRAVGPNGRVYAVDIVPEFVEHIRRRAAEAGLTNVEAVLCSERSVELPPRSVDVAFVCDTYHHFEYPRHTLESLRQALRPGGQLYVIDFIREPGVSRQWVLDHVRAGQAVFAAEITAAGFALVRDDLGQGLLEENYMLRFRRN